MDRFASNTLRTLGIVLISIFVIGGSLIILLFALCLGAIASAGSGPQAHQAELSFGIALIVALILISAGVFGIARLSKGIVYNTPEYRPLTEPAEPHSIAPAAVAPPPQPPAHTPQPESRESYNLATHLSPASRTAIQQLSWAIVAKVASETLITLAGWAFAFRPLPVSVHTVRFSFIAWGLAGAAPLLVLLYALLRHPGPRAFAYALVIPSLHLFLGFFGHAASIFIAFRAHPGISPFLSLFSLAPWFLDILILYLALKAIRLTGIQPNSTRLIIASAVIFIYTSLLPGAVVALNALWRPS